ncbi:MAG: GIY-YIG nuclease family protein [Candidatus Omnitrophota bacterium]
MKRKIKRAGKFYVYILQCSNGAYYTGYTNNLEKRIKEHNNGDGAKCLRGKLPVRLVYAKGYRYYKLAVKEEYRIKGLRRYQKMQLVEDYEQR